MSLTISPLRRDDIEPLRIAAKEDNHVVLWPTHVARRGGELVGYFGINSMPQVHVWMNSKSVSAMESVRCLDALQNVLRCQNWGELVLPCNTDSPYHPFMRKLGFAPINEKAHMFHKVL